MGASFFNLRRIILIILISILFITMVFDKPIQAGAALPNVRVVLNYPTGSNPAETTVDFKVSQGEYSLKNKTTDIPGFAGTDSLKAEFVVSNKTIRVSKGIKDDKGNIISWTSLGAFTGPILLKANLNTLNIAYVNGKIYRGDIEIRVNYSGTGINAINELPMDQYLYGVVPIEMSASWPIEALKAQAVAARTFATRISGGSSTIPVKLGSKIMRADEGFNLYPDTRDQAYGGYSKEKEVRDGYNGEKYITNVYDSVDLTNGKVIRDQNNALIDASYHSNSGGHTEDVKNVWGGTDTYRVGKSDPYSLQYPHGSWTYITSAEEIRDKVDPNLKDIDSITLEKYPSGRVINVSIKDTNGYTIKPRTGTEFGKLFNPNFNPKVNNFISRFFDFSTNATVSIINGAGNLTTLHGGGKSLKVINGANQVTDVNGANDSYAVLGGSTQTTISKTVSGQVNVEGHGWGHGVGMSQWGAYGMAQQGKKYDEILKFYYTGVKIP